MPRFVSPGRLQLWHGSHEKLDKFRGDALEGIVHLGTLAQAAMRSGDRYLHVVQVDLQYLKRVRDTGSDRRSQISQARRAGYNGLVYLNRYEGIEACRLEAVLKTIPARDLDTISDTRFRQIFPDARDSFLSFDPHMCKIIASFSSRKAAEAYLAGNEHPDRQADVIPSESAPCPAPDC